MEKELFYRELNSEEETEIQRLSEEAKKILNITDREDELTILNKLKTISNEIRDKEEDDLIKKYAYELGSFYGEMIKKKHNWKWYYLEKENNFFYCITSNKERACCAAHNYFYSILKNQQTNNSILLFNMIKSQYPKDWKFTFLK
jgi:hypothetical protein